MAMTAAPSLSQINKRCIRRNVITPSTKLSFKVCHDKHFSSSVNKEQLVTRARCTSFQLSSTLFYI